MTKERREELQKIDFKGIKGVKDCKAFARKHNLTIDELAGLRYLGKMTMGQYAACLSVDEPWMNLLPKR